MPPPDRRQGSKGNEPPIRRGRPAPAFGVAARAKKTVPKSPVALYQRYGLVFDPEAENNPISQRELDSLLELYKRQTGEDLDQKGNVREALERVGLIGGASKKAAAVRGLAKSDEFASATDALDWLSRKTGPAFRRSTQPVGQLKRTALFGPTPFAQTRAAEVGADKAFDLAGRAMRPWVDLSLVPSRFLAGLPSPVSVLAKTKLGRDVPQRTIGEEVSAGARRAAVESLEGTERFLGFAGRKLGPVPVFTPGPQPRPIRRPDGSFVTLSDAMDFFQDMAEHPNQYVQVGTDEASQRLPRESMIVQSGAGESASRGQPPSVAQAIYEQAGGSGFTPDEDRIMRFQASQNGWSVDNWEGVEIGEKIYRAYNKNEFMPLFWRAFVRGVGETAAVPAAMVEIVGAAAEAAGGDTERGRQVVEEVFAPYALAGRQAEREGSLFAIGEFIRDNPIEAIFIINTAVRVASRGAGAAARAGAMGSRMQGLAQTGRIITVPGGTVRRVPADRAVPRPEGLSILQLAERQRIVDANRRRQEEFRRTGELEEVSAEVPVGVTGRGLIGSLVWTQGLKRYLATKSDWFRGQLEYRPAKKRVRLMGNVKQGDVIEVERAFNSTLGRVSELVRQRAAFNLVYPLVDSNGNRVTPALVAEFYEGKSTRLRNQAENDRRALTTREQQQLELWDGAARYMRELDEVEVDPGRMAALRDAVRDYGVRNDAIVAEAVGKTVKDVKRSNYIRMVLLDPDLEVKARALKAERNVGVKELVRAQNRVRVLSGQFQKLFRQTGWGRKGPKKSRERFNAVRAQLIAELKRAENAARDAGRTDLADKFRADRQALASARMESMAARARAEERLRDLSERIDDLRLTPEEVDDLPVAARQAYERARAAAGEERRLVGEREAALGEAGVRRVTERDVERARERAQRTQEEVESLEGLPEPPAARVSTLRERLRGEREGVGARERALETVQATREGLLVAARTRKGQVRIAKRELRKGRKVFEDPETTVVIDVSKRYATVRKKRKKDYDYFNIERARNEVLDEYIARLEMMDMNPVLHLVQTPDFQRLGAPKVSLGADRVLDTSARGGMVRRGRFEQSDGFLFASGQESGKMWQNLIFDTSELIAAAGWRTKLQQLIEAVGIEFTFNAATITKAKKLVKEDPDLRRIAKENENEALRLALAKVMEDLGVEYDANSWVVVNPLDSSAAKPTQTVSYGATRSVRELREREGDYGQVTPAGTPGTDPLSVLVTKILDERTIDPDSPNSYYLVPRRAWDGIQDAIRDESFRFTPGRLGYKLDSVSRAWRTLTLNVLPRTAINNVVGSTILAIQGGAGPRSLYYAAAAIMGHKVRVGDGRRELPVPPELRQRYYEQLTDSVQLDKSRRGQIAEPTIEQAALSGLGWWMNSMRFFNGFAEDFGRLAIWYSHAYPQAMRTADGKRFMLSAKRLSDDAADLIDEMARGEARWVNKHEAWMRQSFDFLGDLHRGGQFASSIRIAIPFWQWYAHMIKLTFFTMPVKYPGRALFLQQLAEIGARYQEKHGVFVPYGEDFIPWYTLETELDDGLKQEYVRGFGTGTWYPQGTTAPIGSKDGEFGAVRFAQSATVPWITNSALILTSLGSILAGGEAKDISDRQILKAAQDEYGLPIDSVASEQFARYVGNRLFQMVPLSPTIMSMSGRASTALPLPGQMAPRAYKSAQMPEELRQQQRSDLAAVIDDPSKSALTFLLKAFAIPTSFLPKMGPLERRRLQKDYEYQRRQKSRQDRAVAIALGRIHDIEMAGSEQRNIPRLPE